MSRHLATALDGDVADVLRRGAMVGPAFFLPSGQLDRSLYVRVNEALEALGGKWNKKTRAHVFSDVPDLAAMLDSGKVPPKNADAFFPTPTAVVEQMIDLAAMDRLVESAAAPTCLEPSAGEGAIADLIPDHYRLHCVEMNKTRALRLSQNGHRVWTRDFLTWTEGLAVYDRILMNPPFAVAGNATAWIDHVTRALSMLDPLGVLVSVVPAGYAFRKDRKHAALRELVDGRAEEQAPVEGFAETGVETLLLIVNGVSGSLPHKRGRGQ